MSLEKMMPFQKIIPDRLYYSISEAAQILGCSRAQVKTNCKLVTVDGLKNKKVPREEIDRLMPSKKKEEGQGGVSRENLPPKAQKDLEKLENGVR